jgi:DivIVA domain-containing protein
MAITPQAIKDQEFRVKFKGFDEIEVKAYLELIAEEFFELSEQVRQQSEDIEGLNEEKEDLRELHSVLESDMAALQRKYDQSSVELGQEKERNVTLQKEIEDLKAHAVNLEWEGKEKEEQLVAATGVLEEERKEKEELNGRLTTLEKLWDEQKKAEIDFRDTLLAGQKFSREMMKKSEEEAGQILEKARAEAEKLRQDTFQELARYPDEIEQLKMKRNQVREDLKTVLTLCLENLDVFDTLLETDEEDLSDLFQRVVVEDNGTVSREDMGNLDMELDPSNSFHSDTDTEPSGAGDVEAADGV